MTTPTQTLRDALTAATERGLNYKIQQHTPEDLADPLVLTIRTGPLAQAESAVSPPVYDVIRTVLTMHGKKGEGLCGGASEIYPLDDGRTFTVTWIGGEGDPEGGYEPQSAVLSIAPMKNAW